MKKKKILIIGSNSFAANSLIDFLLKKNFLITGISRSKEITNHYRSYQNNQNLKNFNFIQMNINKNLLDIVGLIKKNKYEIIIDFAGQGMVAESWVNPDQWYHTNIISKTKLYFLLKDLKFIKKFIKISTPEVYGSLNNKIKTNQNFNPSTPYAISHATIDTTLKLFREQFGMPVIIARFANFYGPFQPLYRLIPKAIHYFSLNKMFEVHGNGKTIRSFIHSDDFSNAIFKIIAKSNNKAVYHFSGSDTFSIIKILKIISQQMNLKLEDHLKFIPDRIGKDYKYIMDDTESKKYLKWDNKVSVDKGISQCIDWYQEFNTSLNISKSIYIHKK